MDICFVFEFYLLLNKASVNILVSGILENIYFIYMLEIYLGMELLDFRIWIGSVLVDTAKEFSEVVVQYSYCICLGIPVLVRALICK